ncbi:MAG TPA: hypothetical protein VM914_10045 [Pyrinomonadaceae bacterium]|nr:hypothetical protein [Pyrinomonadaceae bacterium]
MKRRKKIALAALALLVVSQLPFVWRRYRLGQLADAVAAVNASRASVATDDAFDEYAGVFHVHSSLGGHSPGRLEDIVRAAKSERLAFVVMTEHPSSLLDTAAATLRGTHEGILFVGGSELAASNGGRLFAAPGLTRPADNAPLQELVARAKSEGRLAVVGYPGEVTDWSLTGYDAVEVYNLYTNSKGISYATLLFDGLWSYRSHPALLFARFYERPSGALKKWDELNATGARRAYAVAGSDAHANVGFSFGGETGDKLLDLKLDPYERSFSVVRNHVLLDKGSALDEASLLKALSAGRSFFAFDIFGDSTGFRFTASDGTDTRLMGDEIRLPKTGSVKLTARSPVKCRTAFFRDGQIIDAVADSALAELSVERAGVYRVEVYLDQLGPLLENKPWIVSNPIFVR